MNNNSLTTSLSIILHECLGKGDSSLLERTKNVAAFIETLSKVSPHTAYLHFHLLLPLLESAHHVRSGLMYAMGQLVIYFHKCIAQSESKPASNSVDGMNKLFEDVYFLSNIYIFQV